MNLTDWRGDPVIPADWLRGFIALHPIYREHHPSGGPIIDGTQLGQKQMARMESAIRRRNDDGTRTDLILTFRLNGEVEITGESNAAR